MYYFYYVYYDLATGRVKYAFSLFVLMILFLLLITWTWKGTISLCLMIAVVEMVTLDEKRLVSLRPLQKIWMYICQTNSIGWSSFVLYILRKSFSHLVTYIGLDTTLVMQGIKSHNLKQCSQNSMMSCGII